MKLQEEVRPHGKAHLVAATTCPSLAALPLSPPVYPHTPTHSGTQDNTQQGNSALG